MASERRLRWRWSLSVALVLCATGCTLTQGDERAAPEWRLSNGCALTGRGVPTCGTLLGATYGSNSDPTAWEAEMGRRLGVRRTFYGPNQVRWALDEAEADLRAGRIPWISFKLPGPWAAVASGEHDAWVETITQGLSRLPGPAWVAFHHEPETDGPLGDWVDMQRHLLGKVHEEAPRAAYTVILTGWHQLYGEPSRALSRLVPPDLNVDLVGFDVYDTFDTVRDDGVRETRSTRVVRDYLDPLSRWAARRGVAWALAETGHTDAAFARRPSWLRSLHRAVQERRGVAVCYFNTTLNADPTLVVEHEEERRAFAEVLRSAPVLSRMSP